VDADDKHDAGDDGVIHVLDSDSSHEDMDAALAQFDVSDSDSSHEDMDAALAQFPADQDQLDAMDVQSRAYAEESSAAEADTEQQSADYKKLQMVMSKMGDSGDENELSNAALLAEFNSMSVEEMVRNFMGSADMELVPDQASDTENVAKSSKALPCWACFLNGGVLCHKCGTKPQSSTRARNLFEETCDLLDIDLQTDDEQEPTDAKALLKKISIFEEELHANTAIESARAPPIPKPTYLDEVIAEVAAAANSGIIPVTRGGFKGMRKKAAKKKDLAKVAKKSTFKRKSKSMFKRAKTFLKKKGAKAVKQDAGIEAAKTQRASTPAEDIEKGDKDHEGDQGSNYLPLPEGLPYDAHPQGLRSGRKNYTIKSYDGDKLKASVNVRLDQKKFYVNYAAVEPRVSPSVSWKNFDSIQAAWDHLVKIVGGWNGST